MHPNQLPQSTVHRHVRADADGFVASIDALMAGEMCVDLGGGRRRMDDCIDPRVGLEFHCGCGDRVSAGDLLFTLHLNDARSPEHPVAGEKTLVQLTAEPPCVPDPWIALVTQAGVFEDPWDVPLTRD